MKWYIEFPIVYIVVVIILVGINPWEEVTLFVSLTFGLFIASAGYAGYYEIKKKKKTINK